MKTFGIFVWLCNFFFLSLEKILIMAKYNSVRKEIHSLKKNVSKKRLDKLDIEEFKGWGSNCCIYGQLYKNAYSSQASGIKQKLGFTAKKYYHTALERYILGMSKNDPKAKMIFKFLRGEIKRLRTL